MGTSEKATPESINESCRWPVLLLFSGALIWLFVSLCLGVVSSIKMHAPGFWAQCEWVSFGRLRPAFINALIYGFATQAALGCAVWITARLSRQVLLLAGLAMVGAVFLNLGVLAGVLQIMAGQSTGYSWMEIPRQGAALILGGYVLVALSALYTLHERREPELYISSWFLIGGFFAFPWLMSVGYLLAVVNPLRGVMQSVAASYFQNGMMHLWLTPMALAVAYYLIPKVSGREVHSNQAAGFGFWSLVLVGGWCGLSFLSNGPVPRWMDGTGVAAKWLLLLPAAAYGSNFVMTCFTGKRSARSGVAWPYLFFGSVFYGLFVLLDVVGTTENGSRLLAFTPYGMGIALLGLIGFVSLLLIGGISHITEKILETEFSSRVPLFVQLLMTLFGVAFVCGGYVLAGVLCGAKLSDPSVPFASAARSLLPFLGMATLGFTLLALGQFIFLVAFAKHVLKATEASRGEFCVWCCGKASEVVGKKAKVGA